ncbi:Peptidase S10, serine carboxypeptidase [Dillenia turbinata]|uniref:Carboxypeptidase n=1 Tax=Dillenia turbinata TaxID=194707 RepID=A0AAN8UNH7_9MAGN
MALWLLLEALTLWLSALTYYSVAELITSLPGQPPNVSFKQYSGYIVTNAQQGRALFYYFVEAESADPLSCPGCSSVGYGAFMENGPFRVGEDGLLMKNEYSWNLAEDNLRFILNWLEEFPAYKDFFLTGESYAGHYIPQLAALLLEYKQPNIKQIKLRAIALGNPLLDFDITPLDADYLWSHGAISDKTLMLGKTVLAAIDIFNLLLPECLASSSSQQFQSIGKHGQILAAFSRSRAIGDPCVEGRILSSLNKPEVQQALHANTTHIQFPLKFCSSSRVPLTGTTIIANKLAKELELVPFTTYSTWYNMKQVGGWSQSFGGLRDGKNETYLTYATVRGGAHEVPFTAPSEALSLFRSFLNNSPLPRPHARTIN